MRFIDPEGRAVRPANAESFNILLLSLPAEARSMITINNSGFIDASSVNAAHSKFGNSGNLQALRDIVFDERIVDFNATAIKYDYINAKTLPRWSRISNNKFSILVMKNIFKLLLISYLSMPVCANCQNNIQSSKDSLKNERGYDIELIKYIEMYVDNNGVKNTNYFTRCGDTIALYDWRIDISIIKKIKEHILKNFVINEFTEAQGNAVLLLILDLKNEVYEIRVIRGITQGFNNELLRVIDKIEKDLIFVHASDFKTPIVTPFTIRLNE